MIKPDNKIIMFEQTPQFAVCMMVALRSLDFTGNQNLSAFLTPPLSCTAGRQACMQHSYCVSLLDALLILFSYNLKS